MFPRRSMGCVRTHVYHGKPDALGARSVVLYTPKPSLMTLGFEKSVETWCFCCHSDLADLSNRYILARYYLNAVDYWTHTGLGQGETHIFQVGISFIRSCSNFVYLL
jgi:hypothetical protein